MWYRRLGKLTKTKSRRGEHTGVELLGSVKQDRLARYMASAKAFVLPELESERVILEF